jgi:hypothetical protein
LQDANVYVAFFPVFASSQIAAHGRGVGDEPPFAAVGRFLLTAVDNGGCEKRFRDESVLTAKETKHLSRPTRRFAGRCVRHQQDFLTATRQNTAAWHVMTSASR